MKKKKNYRSSTKFVWLDIARFARHSPRTEYLIQFIFKLPAYILIGIFKAIRPLLGPASCKFYPSCGAYALEQLKTESFFKALKNTAWQLLRCNPFF